MALGIDSLYVDAWTPWYGPWAYESGSIAMAVRHETKSSSCGSVVGSVVGHEHVTSGSIEMAETGIFVSSQSLCCWKRQEGNDPVGSQVWPNL